MEPLPNDGTISVNSNPPGATIFLNSKNTGRITPDTISFLNPANYNITLKRKYYKDTSVTIVLSEDEKKDVFIDYLSNPSMFGSITIISNPPGASIIINDSITSNITPETLTNLQPGFYDIKLKLENHRDFSFGAISESNKITTYVQTLRDTSEWVDYQVFNSSIQSNLLSYITTDKIGNKWIGTFDKGLIRFNDISFTNFNTSNSGIPNNRVNSITISPLGEIWIATNSGIGLFNGSSWQIYNTSNSGLTSDIINSIEFEDNGVAWIGTSSGLFKFDGLNWTRFNDSLMSFWVTDTKNTLNNFIWICTISSGIRTLSGESITYFLQSDYNYPTNRLSSVDVDQNGVAWFCHLPDSGRRGGISFFDGTVFSSIFVGTTENIIKNILIDSQNNKWISTSEGLIQIDFQNQSKSFSTQNSLISSNNISCSVIDNNGLVWITTQGSGLNKYKLLK